MAGTEWLVPCRCGNGGSTRRRAHAWHHSACSSWVPSPHLLHGLSLVRRDSTEDFGGLLPWSGAESREPCAGFLPVKSGSGENTMSGER